MLTYAAVVPHGSLRNQTFIQSMAGAVMRSAEDKARDFVNVKDFGAKCDGVTDDRIADQAAIDAVGNGKLMVCGPGQSSAVSAPGLFTYPANIGMTIEGSGTIPGGTYVAGSGGGFVATSLNPPTALLTVFSPFVKMSDLYLDCRSSSATNGLLLVMSTGAMLHNVITRSCGGDGGVAWNEGTPSTTLAAGTTAGTGTVLAVGSTTLNRLTMGAAYCPRLMVDYGGANEELVSVSSVSLTSVTVDATAHNHSAGETVQCHGNTNDMHIDHFSAYENGGWGWKVVPGNDNNTNYWADAGCHNNTSGCELWSGVGHIHLGGNYEGDRGPAVQLGDNTGAYVTHFMVVAPLSDVEEVGSGNNAVNLVCDDSSQVRWKVSTQVNFRTGTDACPTYAASGTTTTTFGTQGDQSLTTKTRAGSIALLPPSTINGFDPVGTLLYSFDLASQQLPCFIGSGQETGVNNALAATCPTGAYQGTSFPDGFTATIYIAHSLQKGGANTLNLNGSGNKSLVPAFQSSSFLPFAVSSGNVITVTFAVGNWFITGFGPVTTGVSTTLSHVPISCTITGGTPSGCTDATLTFINGVLQ